MRSNGLEEDGRNLFKGVSGFYGLQKKWGNYMANQKVGRKKRHDLEFKIDAAKMVVDGGRKVADVAKDVGVTAQSISAWVKRYMADKSKPALSPEAVQLKAANEEIRKLKMQVEFLKKTMAYFVEQPK